MHRYEIISLDIKDTKLNMLYTFQEICDMIRPDLASMGAGDVSDSAKTFIDYVKTHCDILTDDIIDIWNNYSSADTDVKIPKLNGTQLFKALKPPCSNKVYV